MTTKRSPVTLVKWVVHATYSPTNSDDTCQICKQKLTYMCSKCQDSKNISNVKCHVSIGNCEHAFHYHCISKWVSEGSNTCPIDQTQWKFKCEDTDISNWKKIIKRDKEELKAELDAKSTKLDDKSTKLDDKSTIKLFPMMDNKDKISIMKDTDIKLPNMKPMVFQIPMSGLGEGYTHSDIMNKCNEILKEKYKIEGLSPEDYKIYKGESNGITGPIGEGINLIKGPSGPTGATGYTGHISGTSMNADFDGVQYFPISPIGLIGNKLPYISFSEAMQKLNEVMNPSSMIIDENNETKVKEYFLKQEEFFHKQELDDKLKDSIKQTILSPLSVNEGEIIENKKKEVMELAFKNMMKSKQDFTNHKHKKIIDDAHSNMKNKQAFYDQMLMIGIDNKKPLEDQMYIKEMINKSRKSIEQKYLQPSSMASIDKDEAKKFHIAIKEQNELVEALNVLKSKEKNKPSQKQYGKKKVFKKADVENVMFDGKPQAPKKKKYYDAKPKY